MKSKEKKESCVEIDRLVATETEKEWQIETDTLKGEKPKI